MMLVYLLIYRKSCIYLEMKYEIITEFKEKPVMKLQMSECLGIYILSTEILKKIKSKAKKRKRSAGKKSRRKTKRRSRR